MNNSRFRVHTRRRIVSVSVSVHIPANNVLSAHDASAHGGMSTYGLSDICLSFLNDSIELLEIMFDGRAFHYLAVVVKIYFRMCWTS